eukprot:TRINITY_DN8477_c0_g1_i1.p1 TRINITY_DN8477_c0_g1~~TRINITY_DN8477_c0_g1_i1.p1  ORF type:complete len:1732 (-),score=238.45 TRINITY_DN8477_c0_g1_i1:217-5412(-)
MRRLSLSGNRNRIKFADLSGMELQSLSELKLDREDLQEFPSYVSQLTRLVVLWLPNNRLTRVPDRLIASLVHLVELNLHHNAIVQLPGTIQHLKSLERLYLHHNLITSLPPEIGYLESLKVLTLQTNRISSIPEEIGYLSKLEALFLAHNSISTLPEALSKLASLQTFDIQRNKISQLPSFLLHLTSLKSMPLEDNPISNEQSQIWSLFVTQNASRPAQYSDSHRYGTPVLLLDLSRHHLSTIPDSIQYLTGLQHLHLEENRLTSVPITLLWLTGLELLTLHSNQLGQVPDWIASFSRLSHLTLHDNRLTELPTSLGSESPFSPPLVSLTLHSNNLTGLPETYLVGLSGLTQLSLHNNQEISEAEQKIWAAYTRREGTLDLANLELPAIPSSLQSILSKPSTHLKSLYLHGNNLDSMSVEILDRVLRKLPLLSYLSISENSLSCLPDGLSQCLQLRIFQAANIQLSQIPEYLTKLSHLSHLDLSNNSISLIPDGIGNLLRLTYLNVRGNQISELPDSLGNLDSLQELHLSENPLGSDLRDLIDTSCIELIHKMQKDWKMKCTWTRSRILVLGEKGIGKSQFIEMMVGSSPSPFDFVPVPNPEHDESQLSATGPLGISLSSSLSRSMIDEGDVQSNPYSPFTVHPIGYMTKSETSNDLPLHFQFWELSNHRWISPFSHLLFHPGCISLLMYDPILGFKRSALVQWLTELSATTPGAQVILIATREKETKAMGDEFWLKISRELKVITDSFREHIRIIGNISIDFETEDPKTLSAIHDCILRCAETLPFLQTRVSLSYLRIFSLLYEQECHKRPGFLSMEKFSKMVKEQDPSIVIHDVLSFLVQHGIVLWNPKSNISHTIIVNPSWFMETISAVYNALFEKSTIRCLSTKAVSIVIEAVSPNAYVDVLNLLHEAGISYSTPLGYEVFPGLMPLGIPPLFKWSVRVPDDCTSYTSCLLKFNRLPAGFSPRLMGLLYQKFLLFHSSPSTVWWYCSSSHFVFDIPVEGESVKEQERDPLAQKELPVCIEYFPGESSLVIHARSCYAYHSAWRAMNLVLEECNYFIENYPGLVCEKLVICPLCILHQIPIECAGVRLLDSNGAQEGPLRCCNDHVLTFQEWMTGSMNRGRVIKKVVMDMPVFYDLQVDIKSTSSRSHLRLMCDNPFSPHLIRSHPGYILPRLPVLLWRHGQWVNRLTKTQFLVEVHRLKLGLCSVDEEEVPSLPEPAPFGLSRAVSLNLSLSRSVSMVGSPNTPRGTSSPRSVSGGTFSAQLANPVGGHVVAPNNTALSRTASFASTSGSSSHGVGSNPVAASSIHPHSLNPGVNPYIGAGGNNTSGNVAMVTGVNASTNGGGAGLGGQNAPGTPLGAYGTETTLNRPIHRSSSVVVQSYFDLITSRSGSNSAGAVNSHTQNQVNGGSEHQTKATSAAQALRRTTSIRDTVPATHAMRDLSRPAVDNRAKGIEPHARGALYRSFSVMIASGPSDRTASGEGSQEIQGSPDQSTSLGQRSEAASIPTTALLETNPVSAAFGSEIPEGIGAESKELGSRRTEMYRHAIRITPRVRYEVPDPDPLCSIELRLKELDPENSWISHLVLTRLPNEQTRWLCHACHQRLNLKILFHELCPFISGKSGTVLKQMEGIGLIWKKKFIMVDYVYRRFYLYPDPSQPPQTELDLSRPFQMKTWETDATSFGFSIQQNEVFWIFKVLGREELEQWAAILQDLVENAQDSESDSNFSDV